MAVATAAALLAPDVVSRLGALDFIARTLVEGFLVGLHRSPYHGFSVEFAEFRQYLPGESTQNIDWRIYGKTDRHYVKVFHEETNLHARLLLDISASMAAQPEKGRITKLEEPVITAMILTPSEHVGPIMQLCQAKRGVQKKLEYLKSDRVLVTYELPCNEVVMDFYDRLKTISRGYASLDYHVTGYWASPLVKLDILVNAEPVDALSTIVHQDSAYARGRALASKMRELIPRQMFEIAIQAAIGNRVVARETVKALRKNVLGKCYGGDISRKRKLLEKQKEGKKRMKRVGRVEIPQEAFLAVLKIGQEG